MNILLHINKYILRFSMLLLFAVGGLLCAQAQTIDITANVSVDAGDVLLGANDADPMKDVRVYAFARKEFADKAVAALEKTPEKDISDDFSYNVAAFVTPDADGLFTISIPGNKYYVVICILQSGFKPIVRTVNQISAGETFTLVKGASVDNKPLDNIKKSQMEIENTVAEITATRKLVKTAVGKNEEQNGIMVGSATFHVPYRLSSNMRVVVQPMWFDRIDIADEESDSVYSYGRALYEDKTEYRFTQRRRMAFNLNNDSLYRYVTSVDSLRARDANGVASNISFSKKSDTIFVHLYDTLTGYDPDYSHPYPFAAEVNVYDYNAVVHTHKYKDDGERINRMKFLDFAFKEFIPNPKIFKEQMHNSSVPEAKTVRLNFETGEATIKPNDSINTKVIAEVRSFFRALKADKEANVRNLNDIKVVGVASPEGGVALNKDLAKRRARFLANIIGEYTSISVDVDDSDVAPWEVVADTLDNDGYPQIAADIREVCKKFPGNIDRQYQEIRNYAFYNTAFFKDTILAKLRSVRYETTIFVRRQKNTNEVLHDYRTNYENFNHSRANYWTLFEALNNQLRSAKTAEERLNINREIEFAARTALEETCRAHDPKYRNGGYWAYAACILACQYIARDTADFNILKPFLSIEIDSLGQFVITDSIRRQENIAVNQTPIITEYTNYPDVAANQLIMKLKQTNPKYKEDIPALELIISKNGGSQYDTLLSFSKCLRGGYKAGGGISESEAQRVRSFVSSTSVTNSVIIKLAMDDEENLKSAKGLVPQLPENAVADYLKAIIHIRSKEKSKASECLATSFVRDLKMIPIASNDKELILDTDEPNNRAITGALKLWQDTMRTIVTVGKKTIKPAVADAAADSVAADEQAMFDDFEEEEPIYNEKHPFTWYIRALDMLGDKNDGNDEEGKEALFKCFDMDKRYIPVLNVSLIKDNSIRNNKELKAKLKTFRNEYNQSKR